MASLKTKVKGFVVGAAVVPAMGLLGYLDMALSDENSYSLANSFETAYCFNVSPGHDQYVLKSPEKTAYMYNDIYMRPYLMRPWYTYPAMIIFGLAGGSIAAHNKRRYYLQRHVNVR